MLKNKNNVTTDDTIPILNLDEVELDDIAEEEVVTEEYSDEEYEAFDGEEVQEAEEAPEFTTAFDVAGNASALEGDLADSLEEEVDTIADYAEVEYTEEVIDSGEYDENGFRIVIDEDGEELYYDEDGNRAIYDEDGNYTLYDPNGYRVEYDEDGNMLLFDAKDRRIEYDENGEAVFAKDIVVSDMDDEETEEDEDLLFTDLEKEEDFEDEEEEEDDDDEKNVGGFFGKVVSFFKNLEPAEYGIAAGGLLILIVGIVVITMAIKSKNASDENLFASVGAQYASLKVSDVNTLQAISSKAYLASAGTVTEEAEEDVECNEVKLTYTSIDKDLRIKFYNTANDKLVKGMEFEVKLTHKTDGDVYEFKDENMDGIIYETDMKAGDYTVEVTAMDGITFVFETDVATVKGQIEYVVIDVADEVIENATGVEDTAVKEVEEESTTLVDTVEWVESTRTSLDGTDGYKQIDKSDIKSPESSKIDVDVYNEVLVAYNPYAICMATGYAKTTTLVRTGDTTSGNESGEGGEGGESGGGESGGGESGGGESGGGGGNEETVTLTSVQISDSSASLTVGDTKSLSATAKYSDNSTSTSVSFTWTSSNESVATVDSSGKVTAKSAGTATITVKYDGKEATCAVTVTAAASTVSEVTVSKTTLSLKVGGTETITATAKKSDGSTKSDAAFTWASSDTTIATVDSSGKITAVKAGTCNITATCDGKTGTCALTVTADATVSSIKLSQETKLTLNKTYSGTLVATATMSDGTTVTSSTDPSKFTWTSSDTKVATVDTKGKITAIKAGNCEITATYTGTDKTAKCPVMVPGVVSVTASATSVNVSVGGTATITATATMADGTKVTDASKFKWSTVPSNTTAFTVSTSGVVTGKVASDKSPGSVSVYYNGSDFADSSITATVTVNVKKDYSSDKTTPLKTNDGVQVYVKDSNGYRTAVYADYYTESAFYIVYNTSYKYTGWQNIDGNTYFFDKNGNKVTGTQVISGVQYEFTADGILKTDTSGILGIDVSVWQGNINWTSVKDSGINFAIIRYGYRGSTAGGIYKDTKFDTNITGAKAAGIKVGMYFFTQAVTEAEAVEEASACIAAAKQYGISYPIFIDTESGGAGARAENLSKEQRTAVCKAFCATVKNSGYSAGVYASKWWFGSKLNYNDLNGYVIWLAQYASAPSLNGRYDIWQYSSKGSVGGISGNVDMDLSYMGY